MAQITYLINTTKKTIPQVMILMHLMRLESFLMNIEVIFYLKKQRESEKNSIKKEADYNFLKEKE